MMLALLAGSLVPCLLAMGLIALTRGEDAPTPTPSPSEETIRLPFGGADEVWTQYDYQGAVRLFFEGSSAGRDAFYRADQETGASSPELSADLEIDGQPALEALGLQTEPPTYAPDHLYAVRYEVGPTPRRVAFRMGGAPTDEALTITIVPIN